MYIKLMKSFLTRGMHSMINEEGNHLDKFDICYRYEICLVTIQMLMVRRCTNVRYFYFV